MLKLIKNLLKHAFKMESIFLIQLNFTKAEKQKKHWADILKT